MTLDYDGKWKQITAKGSEEVDFTDFEDFNPKSGKFKDTLVYVTGRPEWAKRLFIEKRDVSSYKSFIFEPLCQTEKLFTGGMLQNFFLVINLLFGPSNLVRNYDMCYCSYCKKIG